MKNLGKNKKVVTTPSKEEVENHWKSIWGRETKHNSEATWVQREYEKTARLPRMTWEKITLEELKETLNKAANWKVPGTDGIPNFWLKNLEEAHGNLAAAYNKLFEEMHNIPQWLTKGKTHLIPKNEKTEKANQYRPITCLNNMYKTLTKVLSERIYSHLSDNDLLPNEQKGCLKNSYGCKDHLLTSKMIQKDCKNNRKSLSIAWIDYSKAFDSIPHSWLIETMNIYRIAPELLSFVTRTMTTWKIDLNLTSEQSTLKVKNISLKNGIYQGDSMSPLLFCMALFPLSSIISDSKTGYTCNNETHKISHLLYVDDLKLIAKDDEELQIQLETVKQFSDDIHMEFGLEKCAKATFQKGKLISSQNIKIDEVTTIKALEQHDVYKYLGIDEHDGVQHKKMKTKLRKEYYRRIRCVLKTELNGKNKMSAITALAVPVIQYSFGVIKWTQAEIRKMDRQTRKLLTMYGALHPRADVDRLYIPRKEGGRGLLGIEASYIIATEGLKNYLKLKCRETYLGMVYRHLYSANDTNDTEEDDLSDNDAQSQEPETKTVKRIKDKMKQENKEERIKTWKNKEMHGQIAREAEKDTINVQQSWKWLSHSNLKAETEALITACQEQAIATNYMKARIMKTGTDPKCRLCRVHNETIHHVVSGCSILAKKEYLERHNKVAAHLHWNICKEFNIEVKDKWYEHSPDPVIDTPDVTIIWDTQVQTDRAITANKPDIIIKNKKTNRCILIDIAVPSDYNITQKEAEKRLKYKDLQIEVQRLWKMKTSVIPVVIGCTGLISNYTCETIKEVPGKHNILTLQKTVVLSTARIIRKVL
ncbi:hypothetical protein M8J77_024164 [Diaphorina citri]|nr:hypothetical protein M8J77_024164 [Diaphorina citri]